MPSPVAVQVRGTNISLSSDSATYRPERDDETELSAAEHAQRLTRVTGRWSFSFALLALAAASVAYTVVTAFWLVPIASSLWIAPYLVAVVADRQRKTFRLTYKLERSAYERWQSIACGLAKAQKSSRIWFLPGNSDRPLHRVHASLRRGSPPYVSSNVTPFTLESRDVRIVFLPDGLYIQRDGEYEVIDYDSVMIESQTDEMGEPGKVPDDAVVVGSTNRYLRHDGRPDEMIRNNPSVPLVKYHRVTIRAGSRLQLRFMFSSSEAAEALTAITQSSPNARRPAGTSSRQSNHFVIPPQEVAKPIPHFCRVLGLDDNCTSKEAATTYRELARMYHPDRFAHSSATELAYAEEKMSQINVAYKQLKAWKGW